MKDKSDLKAIIDSLRKHNDELFEHNDELFEHNDELLEGMRELEQENMDKEDENARLLQQLLVGREDTYVAIDAERLRSWKENKAFQYDLAEENAQLRKQLGEKHDDNCRLQRQLAEEHNKLVVPDLRRSEQAQQIIDLEQKVEDISSERDHWKQSHDELDDVDSLVQQTIELGEQIDSLEQKVEYWKELALSRDGQPLFTQEDVDNAVDFKNHVGTDYKLIVNKVNILWEEHDMWHHREK